MDNAGWTEQVVVVIHRVPETEEYEGGFEAVTLSGVPAMLTITATDRDSKEEAFERLREGLRAFGFTGTLAVQDATGLGRPVRYEVGIG